MTAPVAESRYRRVDRVRSQDVTIVYRAIASIAGAALTIIGVIALARITWAVGGIDAAPVSVAGMSFTPVMAIAATVLGVLALLAGASRDRASKLFMGALLLCIGIVAMVAPFEGRYVSLGTNHGWLFGIVGAVLVLAALLMSFGVPARRVVESDTYV